jgi:hypothetical protein
VLNRVLTEAEEAKLREEREYWSKFEIPGVVLYGWTYKDVASFMNKESGKLATLDKPLIEWVRTVLKHKPNAFD